MAATYTKGAGPGTVAVPGAYTSLGVVPSGHIWVVRWWTIILLGSSSTDVLLTRGRGAVNTRMDRVRMVDPNWTRSLETRLVIEAGDELKVITQAVGGLSSSVVCWATVYEFDA